MYELHHCNVSITIGRRLQYLLHMPALPMWPDWAFIWTLGNFSLPVATIILPQFLDNFVRVSKSFIFLMNSFLCNFYSRLATFYCDPPEDFWGDLNFQNYERKPRIICIIKKWTLRGGNYIWVSPDISTLLSNTIFVS